MSVREAATYKTAPWADKHIGGQQFFSGLDFPASNEARWRAFWKLLRNLVAETFSGEVRTKTRLAPKFDFGCGADVLLD